jgi:hypothetical protein
LALRKTDPKEVRGKFNFLATGFEIEVVFCLAAEVEHATEVRAVALMDMTDED